MNSAFEKTWNNLTHWSQNQENRSRVEAATLRVQRLLMVNVFFLENFIKERVLSGDIRCLSWLNFEAPVCFRSVISLCFLSIS